MGAIRFPHFVILDDKDIRLLRMLWSNKDHPNIGPELTIFLRCVREPLKIEGSDAIQAWADSFHNTLPSHLKELLRWPGYEGTWIDADDLVLAATPNAEPHKLVLTYKPNPCSNSPIQLVVLFDSNGRLPLNVQRQYAQDTMREIGKWGK